jgi:hypothetical protein
MTHEEFRESIEACYNCATDCLQCENSCLDEHDVKDMVKCIRLDRDCAETCIFTAKMLASDTVFFNEISILCAKICDDCADECEKHASHMDHCRICAESCRRCAEACRSNIKINVIS